MSRLSDAVRGAAWSVVAGIIARALGLVGTLLLVRELLPSDYGVVCAASAVVSSAMQFSTLGLGVYLIAQPRLRRSAVVHSTVIHVVLGLLTLAVTSALAPAIGRFFDAPSITRYVPGLVVAALFDRVAYVPERLLMRDLRFRLVGLSRSAGELAYTVVSVATALRGWGGYAVVAGNLARSLTRSLVFIAATDRREWIAFLPLHVRTLAAIAGYGTAVSVGATAGFAARRWDNLLVSRYYGPSVMGTYNLAYNLADIPAVQIGEQITDVLFASLAATPPVERPAMLMRAIRLLSLVMFPLAIGLGAIAPTVSATFFTQRWHDVGPLLMVLSALSIPRPIGLALTSYLQAERRPVTVMLLEILTLVVLLGAMVVVGARGVLWSCGAVSVAFAVRTLVSMMIVHRREGIPMSALLGPQLAPLLACVPMVLVILGARRIVHMLDMGARGVGLCVELLAGTVAFVLAALVIARSASRELIGLVRRAPVVRPVVVPA